MTQAIASPRAAPMVARSIDLKWSITLRVVAVASLCFIAASAIAILASYRDARRINAEVAESVGRLVELQLVRIEWSLDVERNLLDWDRVLDQIKSPGQCVRYVDNEGRVGRSNCEGFDRTRATPPSWFVALCSALRPAGVNVERPISYRGKAHGILQVTTEPDAVVEDVWNKLGGLLGLSALTVCALCLMVYFAIGRALAPATDVLAGLDRLASGDLSCRLPNFRLAELQRISDVFNALAANLEQATTERGALARKLVDAQEQERRRLARELHDELAQSLSAMSAVAASIKKTAEKQCPVLVPEAQNLGQTAMTIMKALRATLQNLRPQQIDDLGLAASLSGLVAEHERCAGGRMRIRLDISGNIDRLPPTASVHVYRIVQEGLTNITKHAGASHACVALRVLAGGKDKASCRLDWLQLTIEDDGNRIREATKEPIGLRCGLGFGLAGIRERVVALGGQLDICADAGAGFMLRAIVPFQAATETI
jgi:two-component system sensor histidine kinase UhpB